MGSPIDCPGYTIDYYFEKVAHEFAQDIAIDAVALIEEFSDIETLSIDFDLYIPVLSDVIGIPGGMYMHTTNISYDTQQTVAEMIVDYRQEVVELTSVEQQKIQQEMNDEIGVDSNGKKQYIIPKEIVDAKLMAAPIPVLHVLL